jgi:hypothetical protein
MKNIFRFAFFMALTSVIFTGQACNNPAKPADPKENSDSTKKENSAVENETKIEIDRKYNDVARILAGMEIESSSPFYAVTESATWKAYKKSADAGWAAADAKRFNAMREWSAVELAELNKMEGDIFYPFSGPDIYYSYQFFPTAKNYHLFALEPAGNLSFLKSDDVKWEGYCNHVAQTIDDFIAGGFFHTKHMRVDMQVNGVLPTLLVFLVRSGNTIAKVEPVEIKEDGSVGISEKGDFASVRVDFLDAKTQKLKSLFYHSCDVSDEGFAKRPALRKQIENVAGNRTFTKSASYLMHRPTFSQIRDIILAKAPVVFQDDTAVPYSFYNPEKWNITFFGKYSGPIKLFEVRMQKDLLEAYKKNPVKALPFSLGYHSSHDYDNMMIFKRK